MHINITDNVITENVLSVFSFYMLVCYVVSAAEPMGKYKEGIAIDNHPDVPQQSSELCAGSSGSVALCITVTERTWSSAACDG